MIPLVVRVEDQEEGRTSQFAFLKSPVRIGRGELNDLQLDRPFVSTYHGLIQFDGEEARYVDLGSTNGSVLDGVPLDRNTLVPLPPGAELSIGMFVLRFERRTTGERLARQERMTLFAERASTRGAMPIPETPERPRDSDSAPVAGAGPERSQRVSREVPAVADDRVLEASRVAASERADTALQAASLDLDLQYTSYRGSWEYMRAAVESAIAGLDAEARAVALERLMSRYPSLGREPDFASQFPGFSTPAPVDVPPARTPPAPGPAPVDLGPFAVRMLQAFGESYLPGDPVAASPEDIEKMLGRAASVLETFSRSFLELRRGYEEFGREMGVRTVQEGGALHRAPDARRLLEYLLDPGGQGRDAELQRAFADFMIHQVALLRGVVDGAQALLAEVGPEAIAARTPSRPFTIRATELWRAYEERYHEIADEDSAISEILFGKEFATAYAAMAGDTGTGKVDED